ncbi:MAG TPA: VapE domain-containing protein [Candidatus Obscuribacterales bacterium]
MTVTATDTPNYSASHQKAQPLGKLYKNTRLTVEHCDYLVTKRGLPIDWVVDSCESMTAETATEYLGYTAPSNGIMIRGENGQFSFKPDSPLIEYENGKEKIRKYLTPREDEGYDAMLLAHPDHSDYWTNLEVLKERAYKIDGVPCIAVTEGGFKVMVVMDNKIPCVAALGVELGLTPKKNDPQGKRYLVKTLEKLARAGFGFLMMFDGDISTNINVTNALKKLGHQLGLFNAPVHVASWTMTSEKDKGVDDYILNNGFPQFQNEVLSRIKPFTEWLEKVDREFKDRGINADDLPSGITELETKFTKARMVIGDRIRFNELTKEIEFDGKPIGFDEFKLKLALSFKLDLKCNKEDLKSIVVQIAEDNSYHPVREYFNQCNEKYSDTSILGGLAVRYFGSNNPLYQVFVKKWLIATVARVMNPGCKVDTALILQGEQGTGKSTFFRVLAGDEWFCDDMGSVSDKDQVVKMQQSLITEWAELENIFSKSDISKVKAFLSSATDKIRLPYGARTKSMPRTGTIVGTTNKLDVLRDPTGDRRFWFISVAKKIPIDLLKQERDAIWGAAVQAYKNGETWYLNSAEQKQSTTNNESFSAISPWLDDIENFLEGKATVTTDELLNLMGISKDNLSQVKRAQSEIVDVMSKLKWVKTEGIKDDDGKRKRGYKRPVVTVPDTQPDTQPPYTAPPSCVDSCVNSNPDTEGDTQLTRPTQQNCQTSENIKSEPVPPPKPEGFKVGDKVIEVTQKTVDGYKRYGTVVNIEEPRRGDMGGIYKVSWDNDWIVGAINNVYEFEIEPHQGY